MPSVTSATLKPSPTATPACLYIVSPPLPNKDGSGCDLSACETLSVQVARQLFPRRLQDTPDLAYLRVGILVEQL
jgi:hypothetical protein